MSQPSALTGSTLMALLSALPLPSTAADELVTLHAPFVTPSHLPQGQLTKWLTRLNSAVTGREPAAASLAAAVVSQDTEGHAVSQYGKGWMGACLGVLGAPSTTPETLPPFLQLARALVAAAPHSPAFEREVVQPAMGKLAVSTARLLERLVEGGSWAAVSETLEAARALITASAPPFRPASASLRAPMNAIILGDAPEDLRAAAAQTLAVVHMTAGKAGAPAAWGNDMRDALGGLGASLSAMTADAWEEEPPRAAPPAPPASLPQFSADPVERVSTALGAVEGYTEIALALLCTTSARPVPIPLAQIVSASLRCLNLTFDTPVAPHVSPSHHAALVAALPRVWTSGLLLLASAMAVCGDHLVPHLTAILEHTVYLLERVPSTMSEARLKLFQFHSVLLSIYPAATLPAEYTSRLLKFSLGVMGGLLDTPAPSAAPTQTGGRRNKKRARGAEDALLGGLEGRAPRATSPVDATIVATALQITPRLHSSVPPALLNFSLRLHLSLYSALSGRPAAFADLSTGVAVREALESALEHAATLESLGTARDVRTLLISLLAGERNESLDLLLHPALPPLARPLPPLASLHMFTESEEEKRIRRELGFRVDGEDDQEDEESEDEDEAMSVDEWAAATVRNGVAAAQQAAPAPVPVAVAVAAVRVPVPAQAVPAPFTAPLPATVPAPAFTAPIATTVAPPVQATAPAAEPVAAPVTAAEPFMSAPSQSAPASAAPATAVPAPAPAAANGDDSDEDEEIPELDSGSSDEED